MNLASRYCTTSHVERKGFDDGHAGNPRLFDPGFDARYDAAYRSGQAVAAWSRRSAAADHATAA